MLPREAGRERIAWPVELGLSGEEIKWFADNERDDALVADEPGSFASWGRRGDSNVEL